MAYYLDYTTDLNKFLQTSTAILLSGDFVVKFEAKCPALPFRFMGSGTNNSRIELDTTTRIRVTNPASTSVTLSFSGVDVTEFNEYEITRTGSTLALSINGIAQSTVALTGTLNFNRFFRNALAGVSADCSVKYCEIIIAGTLTHDYRNTTGTGTSWIDQQSANDAAQQGVWPAGNEEWGFYDDGGAVPFEAALTKLSLSVSNKLLQTQSGQSLSLSKDALLLSNKALQTSAGYANVLAKQEVGQDNKQLSSVAGYVDNLSKDSLTLQNKLLSVQAGSAIDFIGELGKLPLTLTGKQLAISAGYTSGVNKQDLVVDYKTNSLLAGFNSTLSEQSLVLANKQLTLVTGTAISFVGELGKSGLNISSKLLDTVTGTAIPYQGILQKTSLNISYKLLDTTRGYISELQKEALTLVSRDLSFGLPTYPIIPIERLFKMKGDDGRTYLMKQTTTIYIMRK